MDQLTKQEAEFIIRAVDALLRAEGVNVAQPSVVVCAKMQNHIKALAQPPAPPELPPPVAPPE